MSTSVYRSEQVVHYGEGFDRTYYGFYISWSGGEDDSCYPFTCAERREEWVQAVREALPDLDDYDAALAAGMVACSTWGPESARDGVDWAVLDHCGEEDKEKLDELAARFDPSEPPGTPLAPAEEATG